MQHNYPCGGHLASEPTWPLSGEKRVSMTHKCAGRIKAVYLLRKTDLCSIVCFALGSLPVHPAVEVAAACKRAIGRDKRMALSEVNVVQSGSI